MFQWIVAIFAILAVIVLLKSDYFCSKSRHSDYYSSCQKPSGKEKRLAKIPNSSEHDQLFTKLNHPSELH